MRASVGIDLSAEPKGTAIATVHWTDSEASVTGIHTNAQDAQVLHYLHHPDHAVGVDCPLGWPAPFVDLVSRHQEHELEVPESRPIGWRREYFMRNTDQHVRAATGIVPLSVAGDRIAHSAVRLAALMTEVGPHVNTARDGSGAIVEVYPAAALRRWQLPHRGYKGSSGERLRGDLIRWLKTVAPWLVWEGEAEALCRSSDHAFDAVVCALVARAAKRGATIPPRDPDELRLALQEGWIHLPSGPIPAQPW